MRICVIGAGVVGMSTAVSIISQVPSHQVQVDVIADVFSPYTTSDGCGSFWGPVRLAKTPQENIRRWGSATLNHLIELSRSEVAAESGAFLLTGYDIHQDKVEAPYYKDLYMGFRDMTEDEMKLHPGHKSGFTYTTAIVECKKYLPWLLKRFITAGGKAITKKIKSLNELYDEYDIIVNCTGLGSNELVNDKSVQPIRGQVIRVKAPWIKSALVVDDYKTYIFPGRDSVVLGGTFEEGVWSEDVDENTKHIIWQRCLKVMPNLKGAEYVCDWVGLRPSRFEVRVEKETYHLPNRKIHVIHNYGHGGGGVTLHWGCALDVTKLVTEIIEQDRFTSKL